MQASDRVLAGRYAAALFQAAAATGKDAEVHADLTGAQNALLGRMEVLRHPRVSAADKKKLLRDALAGKAGATTMRFLELLVDKKRFGLLPLVAANLGRLVADKRGTAKAAVRSARPLDPEARARLASALKVFAGKDIELDVKEDPELIGGVVVKIGDWVLDSSLRGRLRRLKESFYDHGN